MILELRIVPLKIITPIMCALVLRRFVSVIVPIRQLSESIVGNGNSRNITALDFLFETQFFLQHQLLHDRQIEI